MFTVLKTAGPRAVPGSQRPRTCTRPQTDSSQPRMGIGRNCVIDRAIIDKNVRIADGVVITPEGKPPNLDADDYFIRDGIVVIPKNAVIPAGFWI